MKIVMFVADCLGYVILWLFLMVQLPFAVVGYLSNMAAVLFYCGWAKADKHQAYLVALYDKRNGSTGGESK